MQFVFEKSGKGKVYCGKKISVVNTNIPGTQLVFIQLFIDEETVEMHEAITSMSHLYLHHNLHVVLAQSRLEMSCVNF